MRHRARRPFIDLWHSMPRATARLLGAAARPGPTRALVALLVVLGLGTTAYVTGTSVMGGSYDARSDSAGRRQGTDPSASADGDPQEPGTPTSDSPTQGPGAEPGTPGAEKLGTPSPTTDRSPTLRSEIGDPTGSPSSGEATPEDTTPPETSLSEAYPTSDAARFTFSANESASFTCSLDGAAYTPCDSAASYADLDPGWHTFAVRATDAAGNVDPTPAETRWHAKDGRSADH